MKQKTPNINEKDFKKDDLKLKGFKVYEVGRNAPGIPEYSRRDFYKICMNTGKNLIHYANRNITTEGTILFFGNPHVPYSWEILSKEYSGYACVFTEEFFRTSRRKESLQESPLFQVGGNPIYHLNNDTKVFLETLFKKMIQERDADYAHKDEMIRNFIDMMIHEALKMKPAESFKTQNDASTRITSLFLELLERQFPIESPKDPLRLKTPKKFAYNLSVHVNHLNRSVKEVTGKPTSSHINERIIGEAKALLKHTSWNVNDIAYALGYEYPSYFNNFFKKATGQTPRKYRVD